MAGDWIMMRKALLADPKIVRISSALKADRFRTVGGVFAAWCLFDDQTEDGKLEGYTPALLDEIVGWPGLAAAMVQVDWLVVGENFLQATRFDEYNSKSAKRRIKDAVRKMSARKADKKADKMRTTEQNRTVEIITLTSNNKARGSLEELKAFAVELGMPASDGESMFDHWEANGWRNGSSPSKDWQAGMRKWKSQGWLPSQKNQTNGKPRILPDIGGRGPSAVLNLKDAKAWVHDPQDDQTNF